MKKLISQTQYLTLTKNYWIFGTFKRNQIQTSMQQAIASLQLGGLAKPIFQLLLQNKECLLHSVLNSLENSKIISEGIKGVTISQAWGN